MQTIFRGNIPRGRVHRHVIRLRWAPSPLESSVLLFLGAILAGPMATMFSRCPGIGVGVLADPCRVETRLSGEVIAMQVQVTPANKSFSMFDCENGEFYVNWSGEVEVTKTIVIGEGTTVTIVGSSPSVTDEGSTSSTGSDTTYEGNRNLTDKEQLTRHLNLPRGLTSVAMGVASSGTTDDPFGSIFDVDGGELFLQDMIVRDGYAASNSNDGRKNGAGVYAKSSNVSITRCEFTNHLAEVSGGGIYVDDSDLTIAYSIFSECRAGFATFDENDEKIGKGGGIHAKDSDVLIDGCLFDGCFAGEKGGGFDQEEGSLSVLGSVFFNNVAGSVEDGDQEGRGADLSLSGCTRSFGGLAACGANDTFFVNSHVGDKGGAVAIISADEPSTVEFHRCMMDNCSAGFTTEDESQGEGGVFSVGEGATLGLVDCTLKNNHCGEKGGAIAFSPRSQDQTARDATVHLRNSTFQNNTAKTDYGGVVYLMEFATLVVQGDGNVFMENTCESNGAVFAVTDGAELTIEGGNFSSNTAKNGGVVWSEGDVFIDGGHFLDNEALDDGGVFFGSSDSTTTLQGGRFERNVASEGGVGYVSDGAELQVNGGNVTGNVAKNEGGAFSVDEGGTIEITGGMFSKNKADFGGFLYKKGTGKASCAGAFIINHNSLAGGALYAVDGAIILWECDIGNNFALAGPAMYARNNVSVKLREVSVFDNSIPRGSVIFLVNSTLQTNQVEFTDSSESKELSAVQVDEMSSYQAEDTYFIGFAGEAVVLSEGILYLDDCDFSGSPSSVLVSSKQGSEAEIRNIVLGDINYMPLADASSMTGQLPNADTLTNVGFSCGSGQTPCGTGPCFDGDIGVYCQCYERRSDKTQRCISGNVTELNLSADIEEGPTIHPALLDGNLRLSHDVPSSGAIDRTGGGTGVDEADALSGRVLWNVEALQLGTMNWTIFPSTGLLLPGESITLRVVASPSRDFDGTTKVSFQANDIGRSNLTEYDQARKRYAVSSFNVTFYHCARGSFWNRNGSVEHGLAEGSGTCDVCSDAVEGDTQGVDCSEAGATTETLTLVEGYWRAKLWLVRVRECPNKDACKGGSEVQSEDDYCNDGYQGVVCSVCSSGYGRSATGNCHLCTARFIGAMYFVLSLAGLVVLVVAALLAVYLVRGGEAISSKVASTKASVRMLHRRSTGVLSRSASTVVRAGFGRMESRGVRGGSLSFRSDLSRGEERQVPKLNGHGAHSTRNEEKEETRMSGGHRTQNPMFNRALGRPETKHGQWPTEPGRRPQSDRIHTGSLEPNTISTKTARVLSALPLSKIKIVIVVWQISSAFAEVTNVTFPPIYEKLLSVIGVFSLDLGWILSATCLASEVDFYDKLLIVTIGPIFLLGLLAATFHVGSSPIRRNIATGRAIEMPSMFSTPTEVSVPAFINARRAPALEPPDSVTSSAWSKPGSTAGAFGARGRASSNERPTSTDTPTTRPTDASLETQSNWVVGNSGSDEETAARSSVSAALHTNDRSFGASFRFLRTISKAGPGDEDGKGQNQLWGLFARHTTMTLVILYLVYSQVSTVVFQTFSCEEYEEIGESHLNADARIDCNAPKHTVYMIYAAVMIVLYPIGIPAAFFYLLVRQRSAINPRIDNSLRDCKGADNIMRQKIVLRSRNQTVAPTSFLWSAYFPSRYYYEVLECIRRLLLTGLLVFVPDTSGQVVYGCIFAFISLWVFELQKPHIDDLEIQLYRTGSLVIFFTNFLALILQAELADPESNSSAVYSVVLVMIHVMFVLSIGWNSWVTMKATFSGGDVKGVRRGLDVVEDSGTSASRPTTKPGRRNVAPSDEDDYTSEDEDARTVLAYNGRDPDALSDSSSSSSAPAEFLPL